MKRNHLPEREVASPTVEPAKRPIDAVYSFLSQDFEQRGYDDALGGLDIASNTSMNSIVRSKLNILIRDARLKYEEELSMLAVYIKRMEQHGLLQSMEELEAKKSICHKHLDELDAIEHGPDDDNQHLGFMYESYKRGFLNGLVDVARKMERS